MLGRPLERAHMEKAEERQFSHPDFQQGKPVSDADTLNSCLSGLLKSEGPVFRA
jgi:hypothetical protein